MEDVYVVGVGMTEFGKRPDETIKTLVAERKPAGR